MKRVFVMTANWTHVSLRLHSEMVGDIWAEQLPAVQVEMSSRPTHESVSVGKQGHSHKGRPEHSSKERN